MGHKLLDLPPEVLCTVFCSPELDAQDLLRFSRASRRSRACVSQCTQAWRTLFLRHFGVPHAPVQDPGGWLPAFKARYTEEASKMRVDRKVKLIKMQSAVQIAKADVDRLKQQLESSRGKQAQLQDELANIKRYREASTALQSWQPTTVRHFHQQVLESQPVEPAWRERSIHQELQDLGLQLSSLQTSLAKRRKEVVAATRKLRAMQGG